MIVLEKMTCARISAKLFRRYQKTITNSAGRHCLECLLVFQNLVHEPSLVPEGKIAFSSRDIQGRSRTYTNAIGNHNHIFLHLTAIAKGDIAVRVDFGNLG